MVYKTDRLNGAAHLTCPLVVPNCYYRKGLTQLTTVDSVALQNLYNPVSKQEIISTANINSAFPLHRKKKTKEQI